MHCADYDIKMTPLPLLVSSSSVAVVNISLTAPPAVGKTAVLTIDSSDSDDLLSLSVCTLQFNSSNWNKSQAVYIVPRSASPASPTKRVRAIVFLITRCAPHSSLYCFLAQKFTLLVTALDYTGVGTVLLSSNTTNSSLGIIAGANVSVTAPLQRQLPVIYTYQPPTHCRSWGDPHIVTFDKLSYGFQVPGDFFMVRSQSGDFLVQARLFQCRQNVACQERIAVRYGYSTFVFDVATM